MEKYRVFISYSHEDRELVGRIAKILDDNKLRPLWDEDLRFGAGFHEAIRNYIAHSHLFLPVITDTADKRKWVHQEIGYAMGQNIPVLPLAFGALPGAMLEQIQAVRLDPNADLGSLKQILSISSVSDLVQCYAEESFAIYQCAKVNEDRAAMMARYANDVITLGSKARVRQKGGLSSFHIPSRTIHHPVWRQRFGNQERGLYHCRLQREEKLALVRHARDAGCRLIIDPSLSYDAYGPPAREVRLQELLEFLESMPDDKCEVVLNEDMDQTESLTIVGDWFAAESVSAKIGQGYRQTMFTRHAPSMINRIEIFDSEFAEHLDRLGWKAEESRLKTIQVIREILKSIRKDLTPQLSG